MNSLMWPTTACSVEKVSTACDIDERKNHSLISRTYHNYLSNIQIPLTQQSIVNHSICSAKDNCQQWEYRFSGSHVLVI